jgi:YVTN family beta-propeller protein
LISMASRIILIALLSATLHGQNLLVLSKTDTTLAIVDPATLKVLARVPSGPDPHEVEASTDGKLAFISNYGGGAYNTITVVDLVGRKSLRTVDLGPLRGPHGLIFTGGKLWFTAEAAKAIGSYDPAANKVDWVLGTGQNRTHMIWVSPDQKLIVTSNVSSATMTIVEKTVGGVRGPGPGPGPGGLGRGPAPGGTPGGGPGRGPQADWEETMVPVGRGAEGFDVSPNGKQLWAANAQDGTLSILDLATKRVIQTLTANVNGANRLKFTPDGKYVFVSTLGGPDVAVFDTATHAEIKRIPVGRGAAGILMQPDGTRAFVACTPDDYVVTIDLKSLAVTGHLDAGKQPDGLAWAVR